MIGLRLSAGPEGRPELSLGRGSALRGTSPRISTPHKRAPQGCNIIRWLIVTPRWGFPCLGCLPGASLVRPRRTALNHQATVFRAYGAGKTRNRARRARRGENAESCATCSGAGKTRNRARRARRGENAEPRAKRGSNEDRRCVLRLIWERRGPLRALTREVPWSGSTCPPFRPGEFPALIRRDPRR